MSMRYIKASQNMGKSAFVSELAKFLSNGIPSFSGMELHYIKPSENDPVDIVTTDYDEFTTKYGEYVRVIYRGEHLYDINVNGDSNFGILIDVMKFLQRDF
jgi:hypothetical protein